MHLDLFRELQESITNGQKDDLAYAAPRGNAKSTLISFALPIWVAVYKKKHYIVIISDTADQANDFLNNIKAEFEDNTLLINDFGYQQGLVWTSSDLILKDDDVRIQALGVGKRIRGRRFKQWRPDLIICDDLENDENVQSPDQRKKNEQWMFKALSKAGDERTDKIVIGTIIHYDSLLTKLLSNPVYRTRLYKAVIKWSESKLWEEWEKIIVDLENKNRLNDGLLFFEAHKDEMLAGTQVLWPEKESYYALMLQRIADGPAAFSSEKQNEPLAEDDRYFLESWIHYYEDADIMGKTLYIVGFVDPSMGKAGGDFSGIITLGVDANFRVYILDADLRKRHPDIIIEDILTKHKEFVYNKFGVETNQFQEFFKDTLQKRIENDKIDLPIFEIKQHSDKILRIQSLQPDIKNGRVMFRRNQRALIEQLVNFPSAAHDDGPDALEGALTLVGNRSAFADYYKEQAHEVAGTNPGQVFQINGIQGIIK